MTTPAEDQRDHAEARVSALRRQLRAGLAELPALADAERRKALDVLVTRAEDLLRTEQEAEVAAEQVRLARLETKRTGIQRTVLYLAIVPVAVGMVSGALMLFGVLSAVWLLLVLPLLAGGLRIAFGPVGPTPLMVGRRLRAAYLGVLASVCTTLALLVPSGAAETVLVILATIATAATAAFLVQEVR
ncbi:hypothetical protein [Amycolatopsis panacis]|uniref:hypothetical protein n=1 Tax=Amycolatopsis panacis TaxID=2340917 RepID=UPI0011C45D45|nr:hypothetical protein [Amycolatopsis panacis]